VNRIDWRHIVAFVGIVVVVFVLGLMLLPLFFGWPGGWSMGPGIMGGRTQGGWCSFCGGAGRYGGGAYGGFYGWLVMSVAVLFPLGVLALIALGIVWLVRALTGSRAQADPSIPSCPHCGKAVEVDWRACPFCKEDLERLR
jgi:hypothetical protein